MKENLPTAELVRTINNYLTTLPSASRYSEELHKETRQLLEHLIQVMEEYRPEYEFLPELKHDLLYVHKWNDIKEEVQDIVFGLLINKVRRDVMKLKEEWLKNSQKGSNDHAIIN